MLFRSRRRAPENPGKVQRLWRRSHSEKSEETPAGVQEVGAVAEKSSRVSLLSVALLSVSGEKSSLLAQFGPRAPRPQNLVFNFQFLGLREEQNSQRWPYAGKAAFGYFRGLAVVVVAQQPAPSAGISLFLFGHEWH